MKLGHCSLFSWYPHVTSGMTVAHAHLSPSVSCHAAIKVLQNLPPLMFTLRLLEKEETSKPS